MLFMHHILISSSEDPAFNSGLVSISVSCMSLVIISSLVHLPFILNIRDSFGILSPSLSPT